MRIIAGIAKGRKLVVPKGRGVRPTADRVREALFSILGERVEEARVLDLYAGSGSLGIEALSRGAGLAVFIDDDRASIQAIEENLGRADLREKAEVSRVKVGIALGWLRERGDVFDLIFLDPPYKISVTELREVFKSFQDSLDAQGVAILEHSSRRSIPDVFGGLQRFLFKRYGDTALSFYGKASWGLGVRCE